MDRAASKSVLAQRAETMTLAFQSILRKHGLDADYATLNTVLGVGFLVCSSKHPRARHLGVLSGRGGVAWATACRDRLLSRQSRVLGVRLRDLHPPEACAGLDQASEFALHFQDSYVPLIRRALDAGQSVLAWQGWPAPFEGAWGLITDLGTGAFGLAGLVAGSQHKTNLVSPPIQCYVVEEVDPKRPDDQSLAAAAIEAAAGLLTGRAAETDWAVGPAAYDVWIDVLRADAAGLSWPDVVGDHARVAGQIAENRRCALRFFELVGAAAGVDVGLMPRCCQRVAEALESVAAVTTDPGPAGCRLEDLVDGLREARAADAELGNAAEGRLPRISAIK